MKVFTAIVTLKVVEKRLRNLAQRSPNEILNLSFPGDILRISRSVMRCISRSFTKSMSKMRTGLSQKSQRVVGGILIRATPLSDI